ncbi:nitroreductase [Afifella sp. IM 167]|uniref:nitroreductase family protein n=1 Tax=Afifella sp. IM 167 TaxID=2033586 RepID=UPI001CCB2284|nr:nitroreductase [Afifella sp. IM 167]MBZ8132320.1 nitroreductase [Afifella sp. IM 167]
MHDLLSHLKTRRSTPNVQLGAPGPDAQALFAMLEIAARVPDHGKLAPWRFIVYGKQEREILAEALAAIGRSDPDAAEAERKAAKAAAFAEAPLVVGVVSRASEHPKIPIWEQELSAGAVCMNLLHAAAAYGFGAQWLTQWFAYDAAARAELGLGAEERMAGFVHIGTPKLPTPERDRPDLSALTTFFSR